MITCLLPPCVVDVVEPVSAKSKHVFRMVPASRLEGFRKSRSRSSLIFGTDSSQVRTYSSSHSSLARRKI